MRTLLVGDIHGCFDELQDLIEKAGLGSGDRLVSVGDFVDRGLKTPEVVRFMRGVGDHERGGLEIRAIKGNHEHKHLRASRGEVKLALSQEIAREQLGAEYPPALGFFDSLPYYLDLPEVIVVHGGLDPNPGLSLDEQSPDILTGTQRGEWILASRYSSNWYTLYQGPKPVVFGHMDIHHNGQPYIYGDTAIGLDTGCVFGRRLTGLLLPCFTFVSVPSRADYWCDLKRRYRKLRAPKPKPPRPPETPWADPDERLLSALITWAKEKNNAILLHLKASEDYDNLTHREQALAYDRQIRQHPVAKLLHLARVEKLATDLAKRALKDPNHLRRISDQLGLRS